MASIVIGPLMVCDRPLQPEERDKLRAETTWDMDTLDHALIGSYVPVVHSWVTAVETLEVGWDES